MAALEAEIRETHGPHVVEVLEKVRVVAMTGDTAAAKLYLDRVMGPARVVADPLPVAAAASRDLSGVLEPLDETALTVAVRMLKLVDAQTAALEAKAASEGLTTEESSILTDHLRAVSGIGRWHEGVDDRFQKRRKRMPPGEAQAAAQRVMCEALGITVEQLKALRDGVEEDKS